MVTKMASIMLRRHASRRMMLLTTTTSVRASSTMAAASSSRFMDDSSSYTTSHGAVAAALAAATAATAGGYAWYQQNQQRQQSYKTNCCGIVGVVGSDSHGTRDFLLNGLTILKNRGFDSAGIATLDAKGGPMTITKFASIDNGMDSISLVQAKHPRDATPTIGMAHTRWATHGAKTDANAHPHIDASGKIAVVHNGVITNADDLRNELQQKYHYKFTSQTDSEVLAKLIGHYYSSASATKRNIKVAVEKALARCDGTWGLAVMCTDAPEQLVIAANGSPMVIGIGDNRTYVASEPDALYNLTKTLINVNDGEIAILHADGRTLDLSRVEEAVAVEEHDQVRLTPDPYPHWTLKELTEAPAATARALAFGGRMGHDKVYLGGLDHSVATLSSIQHLLIAACGTSLNAARFGELLMKRLGSVQTVTSMDASEIQLKDMPCPEHMTTKTGLIVVSQSGETKDVVNVVHAAMDAGVKTLSVVNTVGSTIARTTKLGVYCNAGRENAVASTKAFTSQVTVLALIALWFQQLQKDPKNHQHSTPNPHAAVEADQLKEALMRLPLSFGSALKTREQCQHVAAQLKGKEHCFVLGKGFGEPVACEGALKLKEYSYIHAEGYSGGALKHGPFALLESDQTGKQGATPVIMIILDDEHGNSMRTAAEEVKARGAQVHIITDKAALADGLDDNPILIPSNGPLTALGAVIPLMLVAYELAILKGINPDTPRNLAKAVLVD